MLAKDIDNMDISMGKSILWISDLGHAVDIAMDIMLAYLLIRLATYRLCLYFHL